MKASSIKPGETYFFVATDSPARKHLEGQPFEVVEIKPVWRRTFKQSRKVKRFFNADGVGARAEELEPLFCSSPDLPVFESSQPMISEKSDVKDAPDDLPF